MGSFVEPEEVGEEVGGFEELEGGGGEAVGGFEEPGRGEEGGGKGLDEAVPLSADKIFLDNYSYFGK